MKKIQMVDLNSQYLRLKPKIDQAIQNVIDQSSFIRGPQVKEFEEGLSNYLGGSHVISCGNGTDALQLALMALELEPGSEIITANFTFAATVEVIALMGLKPVLVDVDPIDFTIDLEEVKSAITKKTKAIIPVHLFGKSANMNALLEIAKEKNLIIIEDNAQALGGDYELSNGEVKKLGGIGHIGTTSFFPSKNLGAYGDGGAVFTSNEVLASKIRAYANHGMYQRYTYDEVGINSRLDSIQAAILSVKLKELNDFAARRRRVASFYKQALIDLDQWLILPQFKEDSPYLDHVFHQYTLQVKNGKRDGLKQYLADQGIPSAIYYPSPLSEQKAYKSKLEKRSYPNTSSLCESVLSLPIHTEMKEDQLEYITNHIITFFKSL